MTSGKIRLAYLLFIAILLTTNHLHAQESFVKDINYAYLDKLIATAKKNYPEVKARQSLTNAAKSSYHETQFSWIDGLVASYVYSPDNTQNQFQPTIFSRGYQFSISLNLGHIFSRPAAINVAKENYRAIEYQQSEYLLNIEAQVKRFYFAYLAAQAELRMRSDAVIDANAAVKQLKYAFEKNETTFQIYNEQLNAFYNQNSFKIQAELTNFTAKANLEELLGVKLEDIK